MVINFILSHKRIYLESEVCLSLQTLDIETNKMLDWTSFEDLDRESEHAQKIQTVLDTADFA